MGWSRVAYFLYLEKSGDIQFESWIIADSSFAYFPVGGVEQKKGLERFAITRLAPRWRRAVGAWLDERSQECRLQNVRWTPHESLVLAESRQKVRSRTVLADVTLLRSFTDRTFPLVRFWLAVKILEGICTGFVNTALLPVLLPDAVLFPLRRAGGHCWNKSGLERDNEEGKQPVV